MNKKTGINPGFLMPVSKIKRYKNNNIVKKEQIRLKKRLNRLIYLKIPLILLFVYHLKNIITYGFKRFYTSNC